MRALRRPALLAAALALLAACEEGLPGRDPLHVRAVSGVTVDLSGTIWEGCRDAADGSSSIRWREIHGEEGAITLSVTPYAAAGCAGTAGQTQAASVYGEAAGDASVGWAPAAPPGLPDPAVATRVFLYGIGEFDAYLVDDTASPRVLYTGEPTSPRDADGFPTKLWAGGEVEQ